MKVAVIGNGMVGQRFLEQLAKRGEHEISVFCEEPRPAYDRVQLTSFFSGKSAADLNIAKKEFFEKTRTTLRLNDAVQSIDPVRKVLRSARYREVPYDKLVIATGSYPFVPKVSGHDRRDCFVYRTIEDLEAITASARRSKVGVVIGGGLLGLEAAKALHDLGMQTHVVEFASRLMAVQLDDSAGRLLRRKIESLGATVHLQKNTKEIVSGTERRNRLVFADGTSLETDIIVFSAGIRPRDELARAAGLVVGERGGVAIDSRCRTSNPDIYAIGECALWEGRTFGLVAPGYQMAEVAARHIAGEENVQFLGADLSTKLKLMGVDVASIGDAHAGTPGAVSYVYTDEIVYKKLVVSADRKQLLGSILVGDTSDYGPLLQVVLNGMPIPEHPEELILPLRTGGGKGLGVEMLPDSALVCSCNNVSKGAICEAVAKGCSSLGALKKQTKAATSCGGCGPLAKQIMDVELKKRGVTVDNHLCEHFPYSRQQLFHLVKINSLKTFEEIVSGFGKGKGCDICKPAVASILASCWNEMVLAPRHAPLQDTNDYFLANLQKNGTYSIVPRVQGGEITPEKLVVLGQVAKKYELYTKITGAQRIDLFGARVEQLPLIWKELVDAGFESGHAYGKALRTVKSCVGSTWCRYGVQDSVTMAIAIENRYRGLRAPHKIKMAVSGCTRECAEAQGKDVGVIATEKGWNLYVCGNGGIKPRHADLLAKDLSDEELVRFIDRFLMFYIRTADRLQRTSTWLENLEGGIDYVRKVVCEDSLGIGAELEADMQRNVETYACEWKNAIETPEILKRFRHFVNSDQPDSGVVFVKERGQPIPRMKVCRLDDIVPDTGVAALVGGEQVAVFRIGEEVLAIGNRDPFSGANVLSRGIVGDLKGELVVASPVYKQHFSLRTGRCLEDSNERVPVYPARVEGGFVHVEPRKEVATTCCYCGVGCGVLVSSVENEVVSVRGDPAHPANRGQLCTKGTTLHLSQRPEFRLLYPEIGGKRASWDEALDLAAKRFSACIAEHGPDSVAFYISGQLLTEDYYVFNKLAKGLIGTNNVDTNSRLCMSSAVAGYKLSLGADAPPCCYEDIDHADLIVIAGSNTAFAHPVLFRRIEEARAKNPNLKVIVIDPRATVTARTADLHLAIKPGTDVALFNAMLNILSREGLLNQDYIRDHTEGFAVPAWAAEVCEVPAESIVQAARMFGNAKAVLSLYCQGLNQSVNGTYKNSALINLHLATGQIGRPGAGPFSLTGQPNAMGGREVGGMANLLSAHRDLASEKDRAEVAKLWGVPSVPAKPGKTAVELFDALGSQVRMVWIACTNPVQSMPDADAVRKALTRAEFVVVQEAFRDAEICDYADVLLPAASWAEKEGTVTNSERRISRVRAAVAAPGEARPDWRIVVDFARRLGGAKLFPYETPEEIFNEHRETTRGRDLDITGLSYAVLEEPQQWPYIKTGTKRLYVDGVFPTPSGRARFVAAEYVPPAEDVSEGFPLRLTTGRLRDQWHTMTRTGLVSRLFGHSPEPEIDLHADDLKELGIADGDLVRVSSLRGSAVLKARASQDLRRGDAFMAMHWGSRLTSGLGANALTLSAFDPFSKQPELKHAAVRVERLQPAWRKTFACPANVEAHRAASALLARFDYAALSLSGDQLRAELAAVTPPGSATLAAVADVFGGEDGDAAQGRAVCACFSVSEEAIRAAAQAGASLAALQAELKCGTNCGSCVPELQRMLRDEALVTL